MRIIKFPKTLLAATLAPFENRLSAHLRRACNLFGRLAAIQQQKNSGALDQMLAQSVCSAPTFEFQLIDSGQIKLGYTEDVLSRESVFQASVNL